MDYPSSLRRCPGGVRYPRWHKFGFLFRHGLRREFHLFQSEQLGFIGQRIGWLRHLERLVDLQPKQLRLRHFR